jgi:hypothetical protein
MENKYITEMLCEYRDTYEDAFRKVVSAISKLMLPTFDVIDGLALVNEVDAPKIYRKRRSEGISPGKSQMWANMLEVTEIFDLEYKDAERFSEAIRLSWDQSLKLLKCAKHQVAVVLCEEETGEIWVTIKELSSQ